MNVSEQHYGRESDLQRVGFYDPRPGRCGRLHRVQRRVHRAECGKRHSRVATGG